MRHIPPRRRPIGPLPGRTLHHINLDSVTTERLFLRLLRALEDWYADPQRAIDYANRPPVRGGQHGESKMALPQERPPINWRVEWRGARSLPDPQARREEILWAILYELDPRAPQVQQAKGFYGETQKRVESASTLGRPLSASRPASGVHRVIVSQNESAVDPTHD